MLNVSPCSLNFSFFNIYVASSTKFLFCFSKVEKFTCFSNFHWFTITVNSKIILEKLIFEFSTGNCAGVCYVLIPPTPQTFYFSVNNECVSCFLVCVLLWFIGEHLTRTDYKTLSWHVTFLQKEIKILIFLISFILLLQSYFKDKHMIIH